MIEKHGLAAGGKVQQIIDSECLRLMDPYVPLDTGALRDNGIIKPKLGVETLYMIFRMPENSITYR